MATNRVELKVYRHEENVTEVDSFVAREWSDFLIVRVKGAADAELSEIVERMSQVMAQKYPNRLAIIIPAEVDIEFYGIERLN